MQKIMNTQEDFLKEAHKGLNIFLSGIAGSGKTYILKQFLEETKKKYLLVAPTGIAAINVGGSTIHSQFKVWKDHNIVSQKDNKQYDILIIDEISMVSEHMIYSFNKFLQKKFDNSRNFGGKQVIFVGDFNQLPPVKGEIGIEAIYKLGLKEIFLSKNMRSDDRLSKLLNDFRDGKKIFHLLNKGRGGDDSVNLFFTNKECYDFNKRKLDSIEEKEHTSIATISGEFNRASCLADDELHFKKGAKIMILANDAIEDMVNGDIGCIKEVVDDSHITFTSDRTGNDYTVGKHIFKTCNDSGTIIGTMVQFPFKLAWAITVHKSQGLSLDNVTLNFNKYMSKEMVYVGLSRAKRYDTLFVNY